MRTSSTFRVLPLQESRISRRSFVRRSPSARLLSEPICGPPDGPTIGAAGAGGGGGGAAATGAGFSAAVRAIGSFAISPAFSVTSRSKATTPSPEKRRRYVPARSPGKLNCPAELVLPLFDAAPVSCTETSSKGAPLPSVTVMAMPPTAPVACRGACVRGCAGAAFGGVVGCGFGGAALGGVACASGKLSSNAINIGELYELRWSKRTATYSRGGRQGSPATD